MRLILDTNDINKSQLQVNCIREISEAIKKEQLNELHIAIAYNSMFKEIEEFWDLIIKNEVQTYFYFLCNSTLPIDIKLMEKTKDFSFIHWYPIRNNFHCKIIYAPKVGVYIGSANMSENAWVKNYEAGIWLKEEQNNDIENYLESLKKVAFSYDKESIYQIYLEYIDKHNCIKDIEKDNQKIFDDIMQQNNMSSNPNHFEMNNFETDIKKIYKTFFNEIYPEVEKSMKSLPEDLQQYPLSYITDQIMLIIRDKRETTSTTISESIENIINNTLEYFSIDDLIKTCEGYQNNNILLKEIEDITIQLSKEQIQQFVENIHSVTSDQTKSIDELIGILSKSTKMGKSFSDMLRYLIFNTQYSVEKRFHETSQGIDYKMNGLAEGRIGEIIGIACIQCGNKDYTYPILNGGVITSLVELKILPLYRKNQKKHWVK